LARPGRCGIFYLARISKIRIRIQGKACSGKKSGATLAVVSIFQRCITQPWALGLFLIYALVAMAD
jgi:hypothetical protein